MVWVAHRYSMRAQQAGITHVSFHVPGGTTARRAIPPWSLPHAALGISQWNGERDPNLVADAAGDVPVGCTRIIELEVVRGLLLQEKHPVGWQLPNIERSRDQIAVGHGIKDAHPCCRCGFISHSRV